MSDKKFYTEDELNKMTVFQLREVARDIGVSSPTSKKKEEIKMLSPCKNCAARHFRCHGTCPQYAEFCQNNDDLKRSIRKTNDEECFHFESRRYLRAYSSKR